MNTKKTLFFALIGLIVLLTPHYAHCQFRVENETRAQLEITFENPDYQIKNENIGERTVDYISTKVPSTTVDVGSPELPFYSSIIEVPATGTANFEIEIIESEIIKDVSIKPFRENELQLLSYNNEVYTKDLFYPRNIVSMGDPAILRNRRIANITFSPFRYNDGLNQLQVIKKAKVTISFDENSPSVNELTRSTMKPTKGFESIFSSSILNYQLSATRDSFQDPTILYIYPSSIATNNDLASLLNWRRQLGWTVYAASTAETGTSKVAIKAYIQDAYDNWENPPAFVTFIADGEGSFNIPVHQLSGSYNPGGDHYYGQLEGNDELEDIILGRLSISSLGDLATVVSKVLKFEQQTVIADPDYFTRGLLVSDTTPSGQSTILTNLYVKEVMTEYNDNFTFTEHYGDSPASSLIDQALNPGVLYWNYRGWIGMDGWGENNANNLLNINKLGVYTILTCSTGTYYQGTSRTEAVLRAGSANSPKGGVCSVGLATSGTHTTFNNCLVGGMYSHIFSEGGWTMGGAVSRGKLNLWQAYNDSKPERVQFFSTICNLMGDSSLQLWKGLPSTMDLEYADNVAAGATQYRIATTEDGSELEDVWGTLVIGTEFVSGYTDSNGELYFDIDATATGTGLITISKDGYKPQYYPVNFGQDAANLNVVDFTILEDGTAVDFITPGNEYELQVEVNNNGNADLISVEAIASTSVNGVSFTTPTSTYGNIDQDATMSNPTDFEFIIAAEAFDPTIALNVKFSTNDSSWFSQILVPVHSPVIEYTEVTTVDTNFGPGASSEILVEVTNVGSAAFTDATATITCADSRITFTAASADLGSLAIDSSITLSFNVVAAADILPGNMIPMLINITDGDFETFCGFSLEIGQATITDPLGPDAYGYYIFDSYDEGYSDCPVFDWVELRPSLGGTGTEISLPDTGNNTEKVETVDLPFTFRFYGREYDQISICSNGWLGLGETEQSTFRNWRIPGPLGASPMIAPFWDDLIRGGAGHVWISHNQAEHQFIIEWDSWKNHYSNATETFQVILYDQEFYPSSTGDGSIKIQYNDVTNNDTQGGSSHGEYATVGIEDHSGTVGIEYTYNNDYPTAARPLEDGLALFITTKLGQMPPYVFNQIDDITFQEDHSYSEIDLYDVFRDPNHDNLTFAILDNDYFTVEVNEIGIATITPILNWTGVETLTFTAEDGINDVVVEEDVTITITPVNDRPSLASKIPATTNFVAEDNTVGFRAIVTDVDSELAYEWKIDNVVVDGENADSLNYTFVNQGEYSVKCYASDNSFTVIASWNVTVETSSNNPEGMIITNLSQNTPNPFNPSTQINFSMKKAADASIIVYNLKGQKVKTLVSGFQTQGSHSVIWNGNDENNNKVSSGVYFYRMVTDDFQQTKKAIMLK
ncbi:MAG: hypothetical protein B6226_03245 [Candidatus Cloacimonetes bacterium 4572_65]|nr:MAG: hypothetical protein B6226_03245 [Candidatus Cloacimonetes bacterium 4572_65]